jgi:hypothetical protein
LVENAAIDVGPAQVYLIPIGAVVRVITVSAPGKLRERLAAASVNAPPMPMSDWSSADRRRMDPASWAPMGERIGGVSLRTVLSAAGIRPRFPHPEQDV